MIPDGILRNYEALVAGADQAFRTMQDQYPSLVVCKPHCSDCCHAVFGVFPIEAAHLRSHFEKLDRKKRRLALSRASKADRELDRMKEGVEKESEGNGVPDSVARARIRCPLLQDNLECLLYENRPITCRVYGIPTGIKGQGHVCSKAGFSKGETYPAFDLDSLNHKLYGLSKGFLQMVGAGDRADASLLVSISKAITTPTRDLIREVY